MQRHRRRLPRPDALCVLQQARDGSGFRGVRQCGRALAMRLLREIQEQREWMQRCGGSLSGYVRKYGSARQPETMYGNGGEAIYAADLAWLRKLETTAQACVRRAKRGGR